LIAEGHHMTDAVLLSACRTPIGSFGGALKDLTAPDLGAIVVREAIVRAGISDEEVGEVILGCVLQAGQGMNVARQAALKAGLPPSVPGETVNRVCGSGLTAVVHAVEGVKAGFVDVIVAGGTESMSNAPYLLKGARWGYRMGHGEVVDSMIAEGLTCAIEGCHMGNTAEAIAVKYGVGREAQDRFAAESQARTERAVNDGRFTDEIVAVEIPQRKGAAVRVERDEYPRAGTTVEKLAALKAAFQTKDGTVTAGNASGINDGAAALVVTTESWARERGRTPLGRVIAYATVGVEPKYMGMGPVPAITTALTRAQLRVDEIDVFELNEAFAVQSIAVVRELGIDAARVNVHGGAIALGHPIGASGARVLTTLLYALRHRQARYGVASLCIGGGMGVAMVVERI
jgi:acetyl-CoA C-acetyltransferase